MHDGLIKTALADPPAEGKEIESDLSTVDSALAESARTGQRWFDAETHRVRGEILLKRNPADPSPAEEASLTAIAIRATPFQLRAAMSVASLYHSTGRPAEAHDNSAAGADRIFAPIDTPCARSPAPDPNPPLTRV
jgi:hypothetical protein